MESMTPQERVKAFKARGIKNVVSETQANPQILLDSADILLSGILPFWVQVLDCGE